MRSIFSFAFSLLLVGGACSSEEDAAGTDCTPSSSRICTCADGGEGLETCKADGSGFGACVGCGNGTGGGNGDGGGTGGAGTGGSSATGGGSGCNEGDCSGCNSCEDRCTCEGGDAQQCSAQCSDGGSGAVGGSGGSGGGGDSGAGDGQVTCGLTSPDLCAVGSEKCCVLDPGFDYCSDVATSCECRDGFCSTLEALCDGPEDCSAGEVCCGLFTGTRYTRFECRSSCVAQDGQFEICHEGTTQCTQAGMTCSRSQVLPSWYQRCRN